MIITKLQGGLGNQLFQYAIGRNLADKFNSELKLDLSFYNTQKKRKYLLNNFNILEEISETTLPEKCAIIKEPIRRYFCFTPEILEKPLGTRGSLYLDGYWQNEKYFSGIRGRLLEEFTLKNSDHLLRNPILKKIQETDSISMHFRRGDYISEKKYHIPPTSYYQKALEYIANQTRKQNYHLFIFSDEIEEIKREFVPPYESTYIDTTQNLGDCEQLIAMSHCKYNIIANSTFSWWAAWLNNNPKKIVVCPSVWTEPGRYDTSDLLPSYWIKLEKY